jgi:hypothetical protein
MSAFGGKADIACACHLPIPWRTQLSNNSPNFSYGLFGLWRDCFAYQPNCNEGDTTSDKRSGIVVRPTPVKITRHHGEENQNLIHVPHGWHNWFGLTKLLIVMVQQRLEIQAKRTGDCPTRCLAVHGATEVGRCPLLAHRVSYCSAIFWSLVEA